MLHHKAILLGAILLALVPFTYAAVSSGEITWWSVIKSFYETAAGK